MSAFKNNLNMFLTLMLIVVLLGLVFMTLFFQSTINKLNDKYNEKEDQLVTARSELQMYINQYDILNSTFINLNEDLQDYTQEFEQTYEGCINEKNILSQNLNTTKNTLLNTQTQLQTKINELKNIKTQINIIKNNATETEEYIEDSFTDINRVVSDSEELYDYMDDNYDANMEISECLSVLSKSRDDSKEVRDRARNTKDNLEKVENLVKFIKNKTNEVYNLLSSY
jgi:chromosome segregation ATPase